MKVNRDDGKQAYLTFGDTSMIVRKSARPDGSPVVDHLRSRFRIGTAPSSGRN